MCIQGNKKGFYAAYLEAYGITASEQSLYQRILFIEGYIFFEECLQLNWFSTFQISTEYVIFNAGEAR